MNTPCTWTEESDSEYWATDCGELFEILDGTPEENRFAYCPFCGMPIATKRPE